MKMRTQILASVTLVALMTTQIAYSGPSPDAPVAEITLSDNPPSFLESCGYVALFLVAAYVLHKTIPPLPPESNEEISDITVDATQYAQDR